TSVDCDAPRSPVRLVADDCGSTTVEANWAFLRIRAERQYRSADDRCPPTWGVAVRGSRHELGLRRAPGAAVQPEPGVPARPSTRVEMKIEEGSARRALPAHWP